MTSAVSCSQPLNTCANGAPMKPKVVIKNAVTGTFSAEATPVMTVTGRTIPWQRRKLMMARCASCGQR